ncbi:hypothetical protein AMK59_972, partial [Oryctes borbonicus]
FNKIERNNSILYKLILSQLRGSEKKPIGRRFTVHDKVLALSLQRNSPKGYRLLQRIFSLPSVRPLRRLVIKVPFSPGINPVILESLKTITASLSQMERYCTLVFDKI